MAEPRVSIAIPTYNRAHIVTKAIDSVLAQTYRSIDIIVIDDGSTDGTSGVLRTYAGAGTVRVIRHERNRGTTAAKNSGLDAVSTPFASILDSDDELLPNAVETLMSAFERLGDDVGMVFGNCVDPATGAWTGVGLGQSGEVTFRDAVTGRIQGEFWGIWRSSSVGTRRFDETLPGGSESLVWHDVYRNTRVHYVHQAVRKYQRRSPDSVTRANVDPAGLARTRRMYEEYLRRFGADILRFDRRAYARQVELIALWHLLAGERVRGIGRLLEAVRMGGTAKQALRALALGLTPAPVLRRVFAWRQARNPVPGSRRE